MYLVLSVNKEIKQKGDKMIVWIRERKVMGITKEVIFEMNSSQLEIISRGSEF